MSNDVVYHGSKTLAYVWIGFPPGPTSWSSLPQVGKSRSTWETWMERTN